MRINRTGATRLVIELNRLVIKLPNFTRSWGDFLLGLIANMREGTTWRYNNLYEQLQSDSNLLCPVLFTSWGGWFLIMKRADSVLTYDEFWALDENEFKEHLRLFGGDDTGPNYGRLDGRLVKIDYGNLKQYYAD